MSAAFGLLCTLNTTTFLLGLAAPLPIILYPLAKRLQLNKDIKVKIIYSFFNHSVDFSFGTVIQYGVQLTDTPIFAIFREVSVN